MTDDADNNKPSTATVAGNERGQAIESQKPAGQFNKASVSDNSRSLTGNLENMDVDAGLAQTCCPGCNTAFEVSATLLASADTRVRCGECLSIFDALANIRQDSTLRTIDAGPELNVDEHIAPASEDILDVSVKAVDVAGEAHADMADTSGKDVENPLIHNEDADDTANSVDPSSLDATYTDFDLFSNEAELPEVTYFDQTQNHDPVLFDSVDGDELSESKTTGDDTSELQATTASISEDKESRSVVTDSMLSDVEVDYLTGEESTDSPKSRHRQPAADVSEVEAADDEYLPITSAYLEHNAELADDEPEPEVIRKSAWPRRTLMMVLLVLFAAGLYAYRYRDALIRNPDLRPWLETACATLGCKLEPLTNLDAIRLIERTALSHPDKENVLVIFGAFINEASFAQPYPEMEVRLTDRTGNVVVQFDWEPVDYLDRWEEGMLLGVNERFSFTREVADPGQSATAVELQFR